MHHNFLECARARNVVLMAGAGVSVGKPSALPGWKPANAAIAHVLRQRLEAAVARKDWLADLVPIIDAERKADRFPPDYQAQLIEEICGDRYFRALQAFDVEVINSAHDGIAALAAAGALKAIVTTNFDRLIERALRARGVAFVVARDDAGFVEMLETLRAGDPGPLPVIKIHGCVSDHLSMVDTLKQRKRGRSQHLAHCMEALQSSHWLYLGFSAADLETDRSYLGLVAGASLSPGATYVSFPGSPGLGDGAQILMHAYGDRGRVVNAHLVDFLAEACRSLGAPEPAPIPGDVAVGLQRFQENLDRWAANLSPSAAGLCLAAMLEAIGQGEPAVRILDRLVRKELDDERDTADYRTLQLHYGRLGAAWGRFVAVPDMNGVASNASVETTQSLLRLLGSEHGFAATSWLACLHLWLNDGRQATAAAVWLLDGIHSGQWDGPKPRSDEEIVDAWLSAAQVCVLNANSGLLILALRSAETAFDSSTRSGDVVRTARVLALKALLLAETTEDVPALLAEHDIQFADAARVGDGFALGMRALALGRWHVGVGGLAAAQVLGSETVARSALLHLEKASEYFERQGMDPWVLYSLIQQAKAFADLRDFERGQERVDSVVRQLGRFPILASHLHEVAGQARLLWGDEKAVDSFQAAVEAAEGSGLLARRETLMQYWNTSS